MFQTEIKNNTKKCSEQERHLFTIKNCNFANSKSTPFTTSCFILWIFLSKISSGNIFESKYFPRKSGLLVRVVTLQSPRRRKWCASWSHPSLSCSTFSSWIHSLSLVFCSPLRRFGRLFFFWRESLVVVWTFRRVRRRLCCFGTILLRLTCSHHHRIFASSRGRDFDGKWIDSSS